MSGNVFRPSAAQGNLSAAQNQPFKRISQLAASTRDGVKSFDIDWILDLSVRPAAQPYSLTAWEIFQWHITLHFVSRLCPLLYIAACAPGINHFPASLLHEMKEFIMVTVGRCEAFTVIYLVEIDWFINTEWTVLCCGGSAIHLPACCCARWRNTSLVWRSYGGACPVAAYCTTYVSSSAHYLSSVVSGPQLGAGT